MEAVWHMVGTVSFNHLALANFIFWKKLYDSVCWIVKTNENVKGHIINELDKTYFLKK